MKTSFTTPTTSTRLSNASSVMSVSQRFGCSLASCGGKSVSRNSGRWLPFLPFVSDAIPNDWTDAVKEQCVVRLGPGRIRRMVHAYSVRAGACMRPRSSWARSNNDTCKTARAVLNKKAPLAKFSGRPGQ
jgi:hypothetical protein